jgi:hypothetical protein
MYVPVFAPLKEGFRFTGMNDRALDPLRHRPAGMKPRWTAAEVTVMGQPV